MNLPIKKGKYLVKYFTLTNSVPSGFKPHKVYHTYFSLFDGKEFDRPNVIMWQEINWEQYYEI